MFKNVYIFVVILCIIAIATTASAFFYFNNYKLAEPVMPIRPVACTMEARICADGSAVGRQGPNCEFSKCPTVNPPPVTQCTKDSDCTSSKYVCQETQGVGTACPSTDPSCVPTHATIKRECKLKVGSHCNTNTDCVIGNLCRKNSCVSPVENKCSGLADLSCPADYECTQDCGPPVVRYPDTTPVTYQCQIKGYQKMCPICLAKNTLIDTPSGSVLVQEVQKGMSAWTVDNSGNRVLGVVIKTSKTAVPTDHKMVKLILFDGRNLLVSPGHPTIDGPFGSPQGRRTTSDLNPGDLYNGARVISSDRVSYSDGYTYDILVSGETGYYFANGILFDSTLR